MPRSSIPNFAVICCFLQAVLNATDTPGLNLTAYSYWALSDVFTEQGLPEHNISFSGNWGLLNIFGVRKPSFRAFEMLGKGTRRARLAIAALDSSPKQGRVHQAAATHTAPRLRARDGSQHTSGEEHDGFGHAQTQSVHATVRGVALLDGQAHLTVILANHACPLDCPPPAHFRNVTVRITMPATAINGSASNAYPATHHLRGTRLGKDGEGIADADGDAGLDGVGVAMVAPVAAVVRRINATSGNPKREWELQGAPDYPSPRQVCCTCANQTCLNPNLFTQSCAESVWLLFTICYLLGNWAMRCSTLCVWRLVELHT